VEIFKNTVQGSVKFSNLGCAMGEYVDGEEREERGIAQIAREQRKKVVKRSSQKDTATMILKKTCAKEEIKSPAY